MALPSVFNTRQVFDDFIDLKGRPVTGTATFRAHVSRWTKADGPTIEPVDIVVDITPTTATRTYLNEETGQQVTETQESGRFSVSLPLSQDPDIVQDDTYTVTLNLQGVDELRSRRTTYDIFLTAGAPVRLRTLAPAGPVTTVISYLTLGVADERYALKGEGGGGGGLGEDDVAPVALSGAYADLTGKPVIPTEPALRTFRAALTAAKAGTRACDIVAIGDSITEGVGTTAVSKRFLTRFHAGLRAQHGFVGDRGSYVPGRYAFTPAEGQPFTLGGTSALTAGEFGLGKRSVRMPAIGDTVTRTFTGVTSVDFYFTGGATAGWVDYTVNGGTAVRVKLDLLGSEVRDVKFTVSGLTPASSYTIVLTTAFRTLYFSGAMEYNGDESTGLRLWDGGHSGAASAYYLPTTGAWYKTINTIQPSLVLLELGTNDWGAAAASPASMRTNLEAIIAAIRAQCTVPPSIVVLGMYARKIPGAELAPWSSYIAAMRAMVDADPDLAFLDLYKLMGTVDSVASNSLGMLSADLIHPSDVGAQMIADALLDLTSAGTDATRVLTPATASATYLAKPSGGTDGQVLSKTGTGSTWVTPTGGGAATTDASQLTSGTLPAARIADGSIADAKLTSGTALTSAERTKLSGIATAATANRTDAATDTLIAGRLDKTQALADLPDKAAARSSLGLAPGETARTTLGFGGAALSATGAFEVAGQAATLAGTVTRDLYWDGTGTAPALPAPGTYGRLVLHFPADKDPAVVYPGQVSTRMEWQDFA